MMKNTREIRKNDQKFTHITHFQSHIINIRALLQTQTRQNTTNDANKLRPLTRY